MVVSLVIRSCDVPVYAVEPESGQGITLTVYHYYPKNDTTAEVIEGSSTHSASFRASVTPGKTYTFNFYSPPDTNFYSRFRCAYYSQVPSEGVLGSYLTRTVNSLTYIGNNRYIYTFTAPANCQYVLFFLVTAQPSYDVLMSAMTSLDAKLYQPLYNNTSFDYTYQIQPGILAVDFDLSAFYGFGVYNYKIDYKKQSETDFTVLSNELSSGSFSTFIDLQENIIDIRVTVFDRFSSASRTVTIDIGQGGAGSVSPDIDYPLFDVSYPFIDTDISLVPLDSNFPTIINNVFTAFPSEIVLLTIPLLLVSFMGWWLHK